MNEWVERLKKKKLSEIPANNLLKDIFKPSGKISIDPENISLKESITLKTAFANMVLGSKSI